MQQKRPVAMVQNNHLNLGCLPKISHPKLGNIFAQGYAYSTSKMLKALAITGLLFGGAFGPETSHAQTDEVSMFYGAQTKHYAVTAKPGQNKYVTAGTLFDLSQPDDHAVNVINTDASGIPNVNKYFDEAYVDERAISVHYYNNPFSGRAENIVVASRHQIAGSSNLPAPDDFEILRIEAGSMASFTQYVVSPLSSQLTFRNIHPMGSLLDGNDLYICGYVTVAAVSGVQPIPEFADSKQIVIVKYDLQTNSVVASKSIDYVVSSALYDYDIATRMKILRNGNLWVTGGCNVEDIPSGTFGGGTLNLVFDNAMNVITDRPIGSKTLLQDKVGESGIDINEDGGTGNYFIYSNHFLVPTPDGTGMNPYPIGCLITYVNSGFIPMPLSVPNRNVINMDNATWATTTFPSVNPGATIISGFLSEHIQAPYVNMTATPYIAEIKPRYNALTGLALNYSYFKILPTLAGAGVAWTSGYYSVGGNMSTPMWGPVNVVSDRVSNITDIFLTAPVYDNTVSPLNLGFKHIITDYKGELLRCRWDVFTPVEQPYLGADYAAGSVSTYDADGTQSNNIVMTTTTPTTILSCNSTGYYRQSPPQSNLASIPNPSAPLTSAFNDYGISVSPNPAHDYIKVTLPAQSNTKSEHVTITLTDIVGRLVATLYNGDRRDLSNKLIFPQLNSGIYFVRVDGVTIHSNQKVIID